MKQVLITGGAGFIGSHLSEKFLKEGYKVICVDNFITGNRANIRHLERNKNFKFIRHDVIKELPPSVQKAQIFGILHFASPASPKGYYQYPVETSLVNSLGTYRLLELAKKKKARFLFASTSEIYGEPEVHPQPEEYRGNVNPVGPRSCYDESKRLGESFTATYVREFGLDARIIRIFNTYGPRMDVEDGRVMPNLINQALSSLPMTVYGDGKQTRSFCFVTDLVDGIYRVFTKRVARGEIFNLGNPQEITVIELAKLIKKITGSTSKIIFKPKPEDDPSRRRPDISKIKKQLGWTPQVDLVDGLDVTIQYFKTLDSRNVLNV